MIGSRIGGYGDLIDDGNTGLLVTPGDVEGLAASMTLLSGDRDLRERLGSAAAARARLFSPEETVPRIERLYRDTVAAAGAG